jgi:hypothetical protein
MPVALLILSSSHCVAKGGPSPRASHRRYTRTDALLGSARSLFRCWQPGYRAIGYGAVPALPTILGCALTLRGGRFVANSDNVAAKIGRFYKREAPPYSHGSTSIASLL